MKTVTSISGGKTSAYLAANYPSDYNVFALVRTEDKNCLFPDKGLKKAVEERINCDFVGTLEDDTIIHTIFDLEQHIGKEIHWMSGPTFEKIIEKRNGYLPNKMARYCTTDLKTIPIARFLYKWGLNPVVMNFGYRANEQRRAKKMLEKTNEQGFTRVKIPTGLLKDGRKKWTEIDYCKPNFPLIENQIFKSHIHEYWKDKPVRFARLNNCVGCHWRNELLLAKMFREHPNKMQWFSDQEIKGKGTFKTGISYEQIKNHPIQHEIEFDDFSDCDTGYCGI